MNNQTNEFFLQWNTNSLVSHWAEFKSYLLYNKPLIAAIQETHFLDSDSTNYNFNIRDYCLYTDNVNESPRQGGSALYISNKLLHHQINLRTTLNAVGVKVKIAQLDLAVLSVYISPSQTVSPNLISQLFSQISSPCLILGDFNAHHMSWGCNTNNTRGTQLFNIINELNLIHINNLIPTHTYTHNGELKHSVIDLAITTPRIATIFTQSVADDTLFSDHYPIHYILETPSGQTNFNFVPRWNFNRADWTSFQNYIDETIHTEHPPDINTFLNTILTSAHQNIPHTGPPVPHRNSPWWNNDCQRAVAIRRRAMRAFRRCICREHEEQARRARFEAKQIITKAKTESWQAFATTFNRFTPLSKIWSLMKCFTNKRSQHYKIPHLKINNVHYLLPLDVATQFAEHYANISSSQQYSQQLTKTLDSTLSTLSFDSDNTETYNRLFTISELQLAIHKCGNTSVGPDQIAYPFFKNLTETGQNALLSAINQLWENNYFPSTWRSSTLIPILKPRKLPSDPGSYRPISLTSCASKLVERMVNGRIRAFLESNHILSPYQNGFRTGRSTSDNLVHLIDSIQRGFQTKSTTLAVFLDLKNAFDKVNKSALLIKLHATGITGRTAKFIGNFLKDRTFSVRCGNIYSPQLKMDHGLPQGSVLSTTLFLIMINELFKHPCDQVKYSIYADDVVIWCTNPDAIQASFYIQSALNKIQLWCEKNGLLISPSKSAAIFFTRKRQRRPLGIPELLLYGKEIKYVDQFKYLGITLNHNLNFNAHLEDIKQRCSRRINIIKCIAGKEWGADRRTLLQLYTSLIRPILDYNGFLFDNIASHKIKLLQTIQNDALRIATGALRTTNTCNLHVETNIPPLDRRRKYQLLCFYAKSCSKPNTPTYIILNEQHANRDLTHDQLAFPTLNTSIKQAMELLNIQPFRVTPAPPMYAFWLNKQPNISFLFNNPKKYVTPSEAKSLFLKYKHHHSSYTFIYTDGSKRDGKTGMAITSEAFCKSDRLHDLHSIFTAELQAIHSAIWQIKQRKIHLAVICTDSSSSLQAISSLQCSSHPIVHKIKKLINSFRNIHEIKFLWIPGHNGIRGNERADVLAKESLKLLERNHLLCPFSDIKQHIHTQFKNRLQRDWDETPHPHLHPIKPILKQTISSNQDNREKERIIARLRLGHTLITHSFIMDKTPPPNCYKCNNNTRYTIKHILTECPHLQTHRQQIVRYTQQHNIPLTLPCLLGDDYPELLSLVFEFLSSARLSHNI